MLLTVVLPIIIANSDMFSVALDMTENQHSQEVTGDGEHTKSGQGRRVDRSAPDYPQPLTLCDTVHLHSIGQLTQGQECNRQLNRA